MEHWYLILPWLYMVSMAALAFYMIWDHEKNKPQKGA